MCDVSSGSWQPCHIHKCVISSRPFLPSLYLCDISRSHRQAECLSFGSWLLKQQQCAKRFVLAKRGRSCPSNPVSQLAACYLLGAPPRYDRTRNFHGSPRLRTSFVQTRVRLLLFSFLFSRKRVDNSRVIYRSGCTIHPPIHPPLFPKRSIVRGGC